MENKDTKKKASEKKDDKKKKKKIGSGYEGYNEGYEDELYSEMVEDMGAEYLNECSDEELAYLIEERIGEKPDEDTVDEFRDYFRNLDDEGLYAAKDNAAVENKDPIASASHTETSGALHYTRDPAGGLYVFTDDWKMSCVAKVDADKWISEHPNAVEMTPEQEQQMAETGSIIDDDLLQP